MIVSIIRFSLANEFIVLLFIAVIVAASSYSLMNILIGAVPDVTNSQVPVITTSRILKNEFS